MQIGDNYNTVYVLIWFILGTLVHLHALHNLLIFYEIILNGF